MPSSYLRLPIGIDFHVHFREPGYNWKENLKTGKKAAYLGGIDTVVEMPNTYPPVTTIDRWLLKNELARRDFSDEENRGNKVRVINAIALTESNTRKSNKEALLALVNRAKLVKVFMANSTGELGINNENMRQAFEWFSELDNPPLVIFHAEDPKMIKSSNSWEDHSANRPVQAELNAIQKVLELKDHYNLIPHITHVSSGSGASLLLKEQRITWDTTPKYLAFNNSDMERFKNFGVMNPPLRSVEEQELLFDYFKSQKIPIISSDHAPHSLKDKESPISGAPGVQELYPYLIDQYLTGNITQDYLENVIFYNPAGVLKQCGYFIEKKILYVNKEGHNRIDKSWIMSKCKWSLWDGEVFKGNIMRN